MGSSTLPSISIGINSKLFMVEGTPAQQGFSRFFSKASTHHEKDQRRDWQKEQNGEYFDSHQYQIFFRDHLSLIIFTSTSWEGMTHFLAIFCKIPISVESFTFKKELFIIQLLHMLSFIQIDDQGFGNLFLKISFNTDPYG
jgi:hypothetical protein